MNKKKGPVFTIISTDKSYSKTGTSSKITWYKYTGSTLIMKVGTAHVLTLFFSLLHKEISYTKVAYFSSFYHHAKFLISEFTWIVFSCLLKLV